MADFYIAHKLTTKYEGGYVNDVDDVGGETYRGISRRYNPTWEGWPTIDLLKKVVVAFPANAYQNKGLDELVNKFYKERYWDINLLDEVDSQDIANELFDTSVNIGAINAVKFLQKGLNLLNKNGLLWEDIVIDGKIGTNTLSALKKCLAHKDEDYLYKILNILQGQHYLEYMTKSSTQEKYARGWLKRVKFLKS